MRFCNQSGGRSCLRKCDSGRRALRFTRLSLKMVTQNDMGFVEAILINFGSVDLATMRNQAKLESLGWRLDPEDGSSKFF